MLRLRLRLGLAFFLAACTSDTFDLEGSGDGCRVDRDCRTGERCAFPYPGCGVDGICTTDACDDPDTFTVFCGCEGSRVFGDATCATGAYTRVQTNASPCEGVAGAERDGGPPDSGIHRCTTAADCPAGFICEFEVNSCGELGTCRDPTTCSGDGGIGTFCDCDGNTFTGATFCIQRPFATAGPCAGDRDAGT